MADIRMSESPSVCSDIQLSAVERELGFQFPEDYRKFLLACNGGRPVVEQEWFLGSGIEFVVHYFYSIKNDEFPQFTLSRVRETYEGRIPADTLSIACDSYGNQILLKNNGGLPIVLFWDHEVEGLEPSNNQYHNVCAVAESFDDFISKMGPDPESSK